MNADRSSEHAGGHIDQVGRERVGIQLEQIAILDCPGAFREKRHGGQQHAEQTGVAKLLRQGRQMVAREVEGSDSCGRLDLTDQVLREDAQVVTPLGVVEMIGHRTKNDPDDLLQRCLRPELSEAAGTCPIDHTRVPLVDRPDQPFTAAEVVVQRRRVPLTGQLVQLAQPRLRYAVAREEVLAGSDKRSLGVDHAD